MLRKLIILVSLIAIAILAVWVFHAEQATVVKIVTPIRGDIESVIRVTGKVINDRTVILTALVDGQIKSMQVHKGDNVKAAQVLAVFDNRRADALVNMAKAEVERERQAVAERLRKLKRHRDVLHSGGASDQLVEDTEAEWLAAKSRLRVAEANLRVATVHREKVEVTAPFAGVITEKTAEMGQWLEAGTPIFTLVAHEGREIEVNVDAGDSGAIHLGQTVTMTTDAFPDKEWQETVHWIAPSISEDGKKAVNAFAVRMTLGPNAPPLLLGQQVDARIRTAFRSNVLKLPFDALIESAEGNFVATVVDNNVKLARVQSGVEDFTHVEILRGLSDQVQVILPEGKSFVEGQSVRIAPGDNL